MTAPPPPTHTYFLILPFHLSVDVGFSHACAVDDAIGGAYCWGSNLFCQLGDDLSCSFKSDTRVRDNPTRAQGQLGKKFASITVSDRHTCAITVNKELYCWGDNTNGNLGDPNASPSVIATPVRVTGTLDAVFNFYAAVQSILSPLFSEPYTLLLPRPPYQYRPHLLLRTLPLVLLPIQHPKSYFAGDTVRATCHPHLRRHPHSFSLPFSPIDAGTNGAVGIGPVQSSQAHVREPALVAQVVSAGSISVRCVQFRFY